MLQLCTSFKIIPSLIYHQTFFTLEELNRVERWTFLCRVPTFLDFKPGFSDGCGALLPGLTGLFLTSECGSSEGHIAQVPKIQAAAINTSYGRRMGECFHRVCWFFLTVSNICLFSTKSRFCFKPGRARSRDMSCFFCILK